MTIDRVVELSWIPVAALAGAYFIAAWCEYVPSPPWWVRYVVAACFLSVWVAFKVVDRRMARKGMAEEPKE